MTNRKTVKDYLKSINLGDYDLDGCEITEEDIEVMEKMVKDANGKNMATIVHEYLLRIREILDEDME